MTDEIQTKALGQDRVSIKGNVEGREITGYAATFGNIDEVGDVIHPGAFTKTLRERVPRGLVKYFGFHRELIGVLKHAEEDGVGLLTVGKISKTRAGDEVLELARDGALTHMSIRYKTIREDRSKMADGRMANNLRELKLLEVGPVDFPANESAGIVSVKSLIPLQTLLATDAEACRVLWASAKMLPDGSAFKMAVESLLGGGTPDGAGEATPENDHAEAERLLLSLTESMRKWPLSNYQ